MRHGMGNYFVALRVNSFMIFTLTPLGKTAELGFCQTQRGLRSNELPSSDGEFPRVCCRSRTAGSTLSLGCL